MNLILRIYGSLVKIVESSKNKIAYIKVVKDAKKVTETLKIAKAHTMIPLISNLILWKDGNQILNV